MPELVSVILVRADGWTQKEISLLPERTTSAYEFHKPWWRGAILFHRDGNRYEVASALPTQPLATFSKLLAATFHNPQLTARYEYRSLGPYELGALKQALLRAIDEDDDVLTQFHDAEELQRRTRAATTYDDVVAVLELAESDPDAE
jgi:hypothetical protein